MKIILAYNLFIYFTINIDEYIFRLILFSFLKKLILGWKLKWCFVIIIIIIILRKLLLLLFFLESYYYYYLKLASQIMSK